MSHLDVFIMSLVAFGAVQGAAVPSRAQLKARADRTNAAAGTPTSLTAARLSASPIAPPTEGITVTSTYDPYRPLSEEPPSPNYGAMLTSASSLGWKPISIVPTNATQCPPGVMEAEATYTESLTSQLVDSRQYLGCCFGVVVADDANIVPDNVSTILSSNQHLGCFAVASFQTELPYGVAQASVDSLTSPRPYPIATTTTTSMSGKTGAAPRISVATASGGMMLFTAFTAVVGAAVLLL